jgi:hypothetical protein
MKKYTVLLFMLFSIFSCINVYAENKISVSQGKYSNYYHIKYTLTKSNFIIPNNVRPEYDGQFEILLRKESFPIKAKKCTGKLILRMPSTLSTSKNKIEGINKKLLLLKEITDVSKNIKKSIKVIIELNPYVSVVSKNPLLLELTNCNVFFRVKNGMYVNHL